MAERERAVKDGSEVVVLPLRCHLVEERGARLGIKSGRFRGCIQGDDGIVAVVDLVAGGNDKDDSQKLPITPTVMHAFDFESTRA